MRFKILAVVIILCLVTLGCVKENKIFTIANHTETKKFKVILATVTPKPITTKEIVKQQKFRNVSNSKFSKTIITNFQNNNSQYKLKTPLNTEYEWIDLNESLKNITINGTTCETGLLGEMYVPKEIKPDEKYPIYILLSRNPKVSNFAIAGVTLCISPSFVIDLLNKRIDLYIHLGAGRVFAGKYSWDIITKHWFIRNIYSESGFNLTCKIDDKLYAINLSELKPNKWQVYRICLTVKTPEENPKIALEQSLKNELSLSKSYTGLWIPIQDDKVGLWVERLGNNKYLAKLYMNEFDLRICAPGLGVVFGIPSELWLHVGLGINGWDCYLWHKQLAIFTLAEKPPESSWKIIDTFKIRFDKLRPYVSETETIENGKFEGVVISDEKLVQWIYPTLYCVKVKGTLTIDDEYQRPVNTTLYYTEKKEFKKGDKITGFVKLITIKTTEKPINYLSAIGEGYRINKLQTTPTPKMTPILNVSAPKFAYVGEVVNVTVYSYYYMVDHQPLICTFSLNPIPNATVEIKKDGVIVKTGKTDENGTFRTIFDEAGEYTIVASKKGCIPATTKLVVYKSTPTPEVSPIEQIAVPQTSITKQ